jgi:hypothetical protein
MTSTPSAAVSLAKAYDELVDAQGTVLSFKKEAAMVAEFTRLYIQSLFDLNEIQFKKIMRKNRDLHAKASLKERQGKNPFEVLHRRILQQDDLGRILKRYSAHLGALDCILDTKATAALVHHMIHLKPPDNIPVRVVGCEFGSGLGILSVVGSIPFVHKGKLLTIHAFEQSLESREDSMKIVEILQRESRYKDQFQFHIHSGDIVSEKPYQAVKAAEESSGPLALWISETFGYQSMKPVISNDTTSCTFSNPTGVSPYSPDLEKKYDPLPQVLNHSCLYFDSFLQKMHAGDIVAFPDIATPKVIIDGELSAILSPDGTWRKLHTVGRPYDMLPPCVPTRWQFKKKPKSSQKRKFHTSPRKKTR